MTGARGTVYLIHFDLPYRHARHYLGWTRDLSARLSDHASGRGARLMAVVTAAGIGWDVVRTWNGTRSDERRLKRRGGRARLCPICLNSAPPAPYLAPAFRAATGREPFEEGDSALAAAARYARAWDLFRAEEL